MATAAAAAAVAAVVAVVATADDDNDDNIFLPFLQQHSNVDEDNDIKIGLAFLIFANFTLLTFAFQMSLLSTFTRQFNYNQNLT